MKLAVSSLAWLPAQDDAAAGLLRTSGVEGVELVPTRYFPKLDAVAAEELLAVRETWTRRGFEIPAVQAILFGRPDLELFASPDRREAMLAYLAAAAESAAVLGAQALVLGAPGNRRRGALSRGESDRIALAFFTRLAEAAEKAGVCFCLEPVPEALGCDFVVTAAEAARWVEEVDAPGLRLNLDTAAMSLAGEDLLDTLTAFCRFAGHVHLSAERLGPVSAGSGIDYALVLSALRKSGYDGWVSIEMKPVEGGELRHVQEALEHVRECWPCC